MPKFSSAFDSKKIIVSIFLLFSLIGISAPSISYGQFDANDTAGMFGTALTGAAQTGANVCGEKVKEWSFLKSIVAGLVDITVWLPEKAADMITAISTSAIGIKDWPITKENTDPTASAGAKAFSAGWTSTRDLGNMMIVLGFVIIGIATSLRIREYEAKKALLPLIIVALLINFSGLICGLIIDASNLTMDGLVNSSGANTTTMGSKFVSDMKEAAKVGSCDAINRDDLALYASNKFGFALVYVAVAASFLVLAILLIARYVVLGMLYILAPVAFACYGFPVPKAKGLFEKWWSNFIKWAFIGVGICFFLSVAGRVASVVTLTASTSASSLINLFAVLGIIVGGIIISIKASGGAAAAAIGMAGGVAKFAAGAVAGAAGGAAGIANRLTGGAGTAAVQSVKSGYGKALEGLRLRDSGSTTAANAANVKKQAESFKSRYSAAKAAGDESTMSSIQRAARTGKGAYGAGALEAVIEEGHLGKTFTTGTGAAAKPDWAKASAKIAYAESNGGVGLRKEAVARNYQMAGYDEKKVAEIATAQNITPDQAREKLMETELDSKMGNMDDDKLRDIEKRHLTTARVGKLSADKISAFRTAPQEKIDHLQGGGVRKDLDTERGYLEREKRAGRTVDERKLSKLNDQIQEIDNLK